MKPARPILWLGGFLCFVALIMIDRWIFSPYPSEKAVNRWEQRYRTEVSNQVSHFEGHLFGDDITFLLYSYHHTANSTEAHQSEIIGSLAAKWKVADRTPSRLAFQRRDSTAAHWTFQFAENPPLVTVLYMLAPADSDVSKRSLRSAGRQHGERLAQDRAAN
jgi:hypothetical protein